MADEIVVEVVKATGSAVGEGLKVGEAVVEESLKAVWDEAGVPLSVQIHLQQEGVTSLKAFLEMAPSKEDLHHNVMAKIPFGKEFHSYHLKDISITHTKASIDNAWSLAQSRINQVSNAHVPLHVTSGLPILRAPSLHAKNAPGLGVSSGAKTGAAGDSHMMHSNTASSTSADLKTESTLVGAKVGAGAAAVTIAAKCAPKAEEEKGDQLQDEISDNPAVRCCQEGKPAVVEIPEPEVVTTGSAAETKDPEYQPKKSAFASLFFPSLSQALACVACCDTNKMRGATPVEIR